uniref:Uncharacterized protein n=1 Tax=Oxyrrhis marina TaxID=2969 RepID=A0A7S3UJL4_OXYMA
MRPEIPTYCGLNSTSNDNYAKTWHVLSAAHPYSAGKSSFAHNVAKPPGDVVQMLNTASSTFRPPRKATGGMRRSSSAASSVASSHRSSSSTVKLPRVASSGAIPSFSRVLQNS